MILIPFFTLVGMCVIFELKTSSKKTISIGFGEVFTCWNHGFQDISILFEGVIDVANQIIAGSKLLVIESVSTLIIAKFFVDPPQNRLSTIQTKFRLYAHKQKVMR